MVGIVIHLVYLFSASRLNNGVDGNNFYDAIAGDRLKTFTNSDSQGSSLTG